MYKYNIEFGDIFNDGHGKTAVFSIECSVDRSELKELFNNACKNTKFNFAEEICSEYLNYNITLEYLQDLKEKMDIDLLSIVKKECSNYEEDTKTFQLYWPEEFLHIFLEFTKIYGGKDFIYIVKDPLDDRLSLSIGYGVFE